MVRPGSLADWLLLTVLMGGLSAASWLVYGWVLGRPEDEPDAPVERPEEVRRAA